MWNPPRSARIARSKPFNAFRLARRARSRFELSYGAYDDWLLATLQSSAWSSVVTVSASTIALESIATSSSSYAKITDSANGLGSFVAGQWVRTSGFATAGNNTYRKVVSVAAGELEVEGGDYTDESAGSPFEVEMGAQIVNGVTFKSYGIEKEYTDLSNTFALLLGMGIDGMSLAVTPDGLITGAFTFVGKKEESPSPTATSGDGSPTAAAQNQVMNAVDNVTLVLENKTSYDITEFNLNIANNLRSRLQVGELGAISLGSGTVNVSGSFTAYFNSAAAYNRYLAYTTTNLSLVFVDADGNAYVIDIPAVKLSNGRRVAGGINQDIVAAFDFKAFRASAEDVTVRIARWAA